MERKLAELNVSTIADLRTLNVSFLEQRFGRWGRRLHELARGIDDHPVVSERQAVQISAEDTFPQDLRLHELEPHIRRLAEKTWAAATREQTRVARTVVLKLKTADFKSLTRSVTPESPPASALELADIACGLRSRVDHHEDTLYRLVGVGLSGFIDRDRSTAQADFFE